MVQKTHFQELTGEEVACIRAVLQDKYDQVKDDQGVPLHVKQTLLEAIRKLSGVEGQVN